MLTQDQIKIIKATAPVVGAHAQKITSTFYPLMFAAHPELKAVFNQTHQQTGGQPVALANAIVAYAMHIDNLGVLGGAVQAIMQKHVSLNIQPEQYGIVGACLMEAIGKVLGEAVTPEIADAWGAAYWQLADILMGGEEQEYARKAALVGGWRGPRRMRLETKIKESAVITSFIFAPVDGGPVMDFTPGQYIGVKVNVRGETVHRNYSLSAEPNGRTYRISVKKEPHGLVSTFLHQDVDVGHEIDIYPPAGEFTLRPGSGPVALITAGVGQTPALPMLGAALKTNRPVTYIHAALNGAVHAFKTHVLDIAKRTPLLTPVFVYSDPLQDDAPDHTGLVTEDILMKCLPRDPATEVYFLGPTPFMKQQRASLRNLKVPDHRIAFEFFGPAEALG
jgi:nitric oxide dioxygenase